MTVGLLTIVSLRQMRVVTYVFATYELALAQAQENFTAVTFRVERDPESQQLNGLRQTTMRLPEAFELLTVQELEVGEAVLPVPA